jgi:multicomponent Na+:H+ antiporter subunit D
VLRIAAYNIVIAVGFILIGLASGTENALAGSVFYLIHDMIAKALLFLLVGLMVFLTGEKFIDNMSGLIRNYPLFGWIYFLTMLALVGIPPLSGFVGKILIGKGAIEAGSYVLLFLGFASSLVVLFSLLKIFLSSFFGETIITNEDKKPLPIASMVSLVAFALCIVVMGLGAEQLMAYVKDAAKILVNPSIYIDAILSESEGV